MAEPNLPSELDPVQSQARPPSRDRTPADDSALPTLGEKSDQFGEKQGPNSSEVEPSAIGQPTFGSAISSPAPEGEFLTSPEQAQAQARQAADRMGVFRDLPREITAKEWNSGGTRKLILERMAQLESELIELKRYRSQYYEKDKESAVLRQKSRQSTAVDMLFNFCLSAGGILVGLAPSLFDKGHAIICLFLVVTGTVLVACPALLKLYQKSD